jgi:hypothetical protein
MRPKTKGEDADTQADARAGPHDDEDLIVVRPLGHTALDHLAIRAGLSALETIRAGLSAL